MFAALRNAVTVTRVLLLYGATVTEEGCLILPRKAGKRSNAILEEDLAKRGKYSVTDIAQWTEDGVSRMALQKVRYSVSKHML